MASPGVTDEPRRSEAACASRRDSSRSKGVPARGRVESGALVIGGRVGSGEALDEAVERWPRARDELREQARDGPREAGRSPRAPIEGEQSASPERREVIVFVPVAGGPGGPEVHVASRKEGRRVGGGVLGPTDRGSHLAGGLGGQPESELKVDQALPLDAWTRSIPRPGGAQVDVGLEEPLQAPGGRHRLDREAAHSRGEEGLDDLGREAVATEPPRKLERERGSPRSARATSRPARAISAARSGRPSKPWSAMRIPAYAPAMDQVPDLRDDVSDAAVPGGRTEGLVAGPGSRARRPERFGRWPTEASGDSTRPASGSPSRRRVRRSASGRPGPTRGRLAPWRALRGGH